MFDSRELARKALQRVEQLNKAKRRKMLSATMLSTAICISAALLLVFAAPTESEITIADPEPPLRYIDEPGVPLASPPADTVRLCYECDTEITYEACEYC